MTVNLHDLISRSAKARPDAPALIAGDRVMSYAALVQRSNAIASVLRELGVRRGDRVAMYMQRSFDSVAAIFAIAQAGAAYVPLESGAPPARLAGLIDNYELDHAIVDAHHHEPLAAVLEHSPRRLR